MGDAFGCMAGTHPAWASGQEMCGFDVSEGQLGDGFGCMTGTHPAWALAPEARLPVQGHGGVVPGSSVGWRALAMPQPRLAASHLTITEGAPASPPVVHVSHNHD